MENWQYLILYKNSLLRYSKTLELKTSNGVITVYKYLLDKRFIRKCSLDSLEFIFRKCKIKNNDSYWYIIYSPIYLNNEYVFDNLDRYKLIKSLEEFIEIVR